MSNRLLIRSSWRFFTRHSWQLWLTLLSIAPGNGGDHCGRSGQPDGAAVARLLTEPGARVAVGDDVLVADIATAQGDFPGLTSIQLKLTAAEAAALQTRLPPNLKLESFAARQQVFTQMTQAFSTNLMAMSLLALLVGAFLVYNTMTFSVLQRRQSFAIGRMLGVTGGQLFRWKHWCWGWAS